MTGQTDHERIWLEPAGAPDRSWCQDNVWGDDAVEYIRADVAPPPQIHVMVDAPVAWIAKARWEQMTAAEPWLTNIVYSEDQSASFPCVPLFASGKSFADGIRAAAGLFITDTSEPVDDMTKLIREANRQNILRLIGSAAQPAPAVHVAVKPLEWKRVAGDIEVAGSYKIDRMRPWLSGKPKKYWVQVALGFGFKTIGTLCASAGEAKAIAKAHYDEQIRAALATATEGSADA